MFRIYWVVDRIKRYPTTIVQCSFACSLPLSLFADYRFVVSFLFRTSGKECEYHSQAGSTTLSGQLICAIEDTALQVKYFIGSIDLQRYDQLSCTFYNMNVALCCLFRWSNVNLAGSKMNTCSQQCRGELVDFHCNLSPYSLKVALKLPQSLPKVKYKLFKM